MTDLQLDLPVLCDDGIPVEMCVTDNITAREILQQVIAFRKASCPALVISITDCALSIDAGGTVRILSLDSRVDLSSYATRDPYKKSGTPLVINAFGFRAKAAEALRNQTLNDYLISKAVLELRYLIQSSTAYRQSETDRITSHNSYENRECALIDAERILSETLRRDNIFSTRAISSSSNSNCASVKDSKGRADHTLKSLNAHSDTEKNASNAGRQESLEALVHEQYLDFDYNVRGILHDSGLLDSDAGIELINKAENLIHLGNVQGLLTAIFDYEQGNQSEQSASTVSPKHCTPHDRLVGSTSKRGLDEVTGHSGVTKFQRSETQSFPTLSADAMMGYRARQNIDFSTQSSTNDFFSATAVENVSPTARVAQQNDGNITQPSCHTVAADISNARGSGSDNGKCLLSGQQGAVASEDENEDEDDMMVPVLQEDTAELSLRSQPNKRSLDKEPSSWPYTPTALGLEHNGRLSDTGWTDTTTKTASASTSASATASASSPLLPRVTHDIGKDNVVNMNDPQCIEHVEVTNDSDLRVDDIAALNPARVCATVGYNHSDVTSTAAAASSSASVVSHGECSLAATASGSLASIALSSSSSSRPLLPLATAETTATATTAIVSIASSIVSDRLGSPLAPHISGEISSQVSEAASVPCNGSTSSVFEEGCGSILKAPLKECAASTVPGIFDDEAKHDIGRDMDVDVDDDVDEGSRPLKHEVFESNQSSGASGTAGEGKLKVKHQESDSLLAYEDCVSFTEHLERNIIGTKETSAMVQMEVVIEEEGQNSQAREKVLGEMDDMGDAAAKDDTIAILDNAVEMVQRSDGDLDSISVLDVQLETQVENGGDVQAGVKPEEGIGTVRKEGEGRAESDTSGAIEGERECEGSHFKVMPIQADGEAIIDTHTGFNTSTAHEMEEVEATEDIQQALVSGRVKERAVAAIGQCKIVAEGDEEEGDELDRKDGSDSGAAKSDEGEGGKKGEGEGEGEGGEGKRAYSQTDHGILDSVVSGAESEPEDVSVHVDSVVDVEEGVTKEDDEDQNVLEEDEDSDEDDVSFLPFQIDSALMLTQPRLQDRGESQETFYEKSSCDLLYGNQNSILDLAPSSSSRFDGSSYDDAEEDEDGGSGFHTADDDVAIDATTTPKDQNSTFSPSIAFIAATDDSSDGIPCGQPLPLSPSQNKKGGSAAVLVGSDDNQMADSVGVERGLGRVRVAEGVRDPAVEEMLVELPGVREEGLLPSEGEGQEIPGQESRTPTGAAESPICTQQDPSYRDGARADDQSNLILEASLRETKARTRAGTGAVLAAEDPQRVSRAEQLAEQKRYLEARRAALEREECRTDAVSSTDPSSSSDEESDSSVVLIESAGVRGTAFDGFDSSPIQGTESAADRRRADGSSNAPADVTHTQHDSMVSDVSPQRKRGRPTKQDSILIKSNLKALQAAQKITKLKKKMAINDESPSPSALNSWSDGAESGVLHRIVRPYRVREVSAISRAVTRQRSHVRGGADLDSSPDGTPALNDSTRQPHLPDASATIDHSNSDTSDVPPMSPSGTATTPRQHSTQDPGSPIPRVSTVKKALRSPMGNRMTTRTAVRTESPASVTQAQAVARGRGGDDVKVKKGMRKELPSPVEDVSHIEEEDSGTYEEVVTSVDEEENDNDTSEEESAGDDGDGDYEEEESESLDEEALNESSTRVPKSKSTPKIPKKKIVVTAKSSKKASQGVKVKRPVVAVVRPVVAVVRRDVVNREPRHHPTLSPPSSPSSEEPEVETESEEAVAGAEGVGMGAVGRTRKPTKALSARAQDAIRRKSLLGQVEDYTKRQSILGSIFSDSSGSDADSRIGGVKSSEGGSGAIDEIALDSMNGATSDISDDLDKKESSDSDSGSDSHEEEGHKRDIDDEGAGSSGGGKLRQSDVSNLSNRAVTEKDSSDEGSDVLTATSTNVKKRLSFQQSAADKGPMHRPPSSGSTASTSSSPSYLSPRGPGTVFPPRKSPLIYSQDTVSKKPAAALPLPLPAINLKKFDTPFATINSAHRGSINRKRPLQAMLAAQPSFIGTASTGLAQRKQPEPEPQPESEQEPDHSDHETLPSAVSPSENSEVSRLNAANMVRRQKKMRKDERKENHKRSLDAARAAKGPPSAPTARASSVFSDSDTDASHAMSPSEKGRQKEGEDSASSVDAMEESEEQKRLRRVTACEKLLQNRRSSVGAGENMRADVNVQQRADKRKDREDDGSNSNVGKKRGRPPGALNQKKEDRRKKTQAMQSGRTAMEKKRTSSAPSTRQSTGSLKPRDSPGGDSHRAQGATQGADSAGVSAPRGYRTSIGLSSLSSIGMGVGGGMGAHAKAVSGVNLSTLTGAGKVRPVPAAITFNAQASGDRRTSTSTTTTSRTDSSSSSSSRKDSSRSKSARLHLSNVESYLV